MSQDGAFSVLLIAAKAEPITKIAVAISKIPFFNITFSSQRVLDQIGTRASTLASAK